MAAQGHEPMKIGLLHHVGSRGQSRRNRPESRHCGRKVRFRPLTHRHGGCAGTSLLSHKRTLALPKAVGCWPLTTLREKLIKIGVKIVRHGRYVTFKLAGVAVPRDLFQKFLMLIDDLRPRPAPA